jgi:hypothetical protein
VVPSGVSLLAAGAIVWLTAQRAERRARPVSRVGRFREAVSRMVDQPEHVSATQSLPSRILAAARSAMAAIAARKLVAHGFDGTLKGLPRRPGPQPVDAKSSRRPNPALSPRDGFEHTQFSR